MVGAPARKVQNRVRRVDVMLDEQLIRKHSNRIHVNGQGGPIKIGPPILDHHIRRYTQCWDTTKVGRRDEIGQSALTLVVLHLQVKHRLLNHTGGQVGL